VQALPRSGSDHTPLLLDTGEQAHLGNKVDFSFELSWLKIEGFKEVVIREWLSIPRVDNPMLNWQNKIRHLRQYLRGWARDLSGKYKIERDRLTHIIDYLEKKLKVADLNDSEREALKRANDEVSSLRRVEESKWAQRAKVKHIQEGGSNTRYFHLIANGKHRCKKIIQLEQDEGTIIGQENLKTYISEYYKSLFGPPEYSNVSLVEDFNSNIPLLSHDENSILIAEFSEKEIFDAIDQMEKNKAPGPDGFPAEFFQNFWDLIKDDLMDMFRSFFNAELPLFHLNYGTIILLPKKENAVQIQ
jgi:mannosylglycoprotein endo-beta-mannosidase